MVRGYYDVMISGAGVSSNTMVFVFEIHVVQ